MTVINDEKLKHTVTAASMIVSGVVLKNSFGQLKNVSTTTKTYAGFLGLILFVAGWIYLAVALSDRKKDKLKYVFPCLVIMLIVIVPKSGLSKTIMMVSALIFSLSWIALGYRVGDHLQGPKKYSGLIASLFVIASMISALPYQRKMCVVDGPGMVLFTVAWAIVSIVNSTV